MTQYRCNEEQTTKSAERPEKETDPSLKLREGYGHHSRDLLNHHWDVGEEAPSKVDDELQQVGTDSHQHNHNTQNFGDE